MIVILGAALSKWEVEHMSDEKSLQAKVFDHANAIVVLTRHNASIGNAVQAGRVIERVDRHANCLLKAFRELTAAKGEGTPGTT